MLLWEIEVDGYRGKRRLNYKRFILALLIVIALFAGIGVGIKFGIDFAINKFSEASGLSDSNPPKDVIPDDITINMVAIGDVMCHSTNFNAAYIKESNTYDFSPVFANVAKYITKADIAIRKFGNNFCRSR